MTKIERLILAIAALDTEQGVNHWWRRVYSLPDRTTPGDVWTWLRETAAPIEYDDAKLKRGKKAV